MTADFWEMRRVGNSPATSASVGSISITQHGEKPARFSFLKKVSIPRSLTFPSLCLFILFPVVEWDFARQIILSLSIQGVCLSFRGLTVGWTLCGGLENSPTQKRAAQQETPPTLWSTCYTRSIGLLQEVLGVYQETDETTERQMVKNGQQKKSFLLLSCLLFVRWERFVCRKKDWRHQIYRNI